jgi:hypothetical protein
MDDAERRAIALQEADELAESQAQPAEIGTESGE